MTIWFTSDTHFGHARIIELSNRPFKDVDHMNEMLVKNWNSVVSPNDAVYHLGDVALGSFDDSIAHVGRLNGTKILVVGNHDRLFIDPEVSNLEKAERYAGRFRPKYEDVFQFIIEGDKDSAAESSFELADGTVVRFSHFPYTGDSHDKPRYDLIRPKDDGTLLLHGHTHQSHNVSKSAKGTLQIHVGVDSWNYFPVPEDEILNILHDVK